MLHWAPPMPLIADRPAWIAPGQAVTLVWYEGRLDRPDGARLYQVAGPTLDPAPPTAGFLLSPVAQDGFADRVYAGQATLADLQAFLEGSTLAAGQLVDGGEWLVAHAETAPLALLEGWDGEPARPLVPYEREIGAFLPGDLLLRVSPEAYAGASTSPEGFRTAWVCDECGEAEDAGVFLWTRRRGPRVRVLLLIVNEAGVWTCHLHPFEWAPEALPA